MASDALLAVQAVGDQFILNGREVTGAYTSGASEVEEENNAYFVRYASFLCDPDDVPKTRPVVIKREGINYTATNIIFGDDGVAEIRTKAVTMKELAPKDVLPRQVQ